MELDGLPPGSYQQQHHQQRQRGGQRGRGARGGHQQRQRHPEPEPGKPVEGCWFCLSSDQVRGAERVLWRWWGREGAVAPAVNCPRDGLSVAGGALQRLEGCWSLASAAR